MTYSQSKALFEAMDNLECYAKMHSREIHHNYEETDYDAMTRYKEYIDVAKCKIFNLMVQCND